MNNVERANDWNSKYPEGTIVLVRGKCGRAGRAVPACFNRVFIRVDGIIENLREVTPNDASAATAAPEAGVERRERNQ